uniref:Uncharacterized protein n=1 Tax=Candidatus Kentrum sp. SD TaxID=2126332 RepID=A0A451BNK8_9GAMM|nr:MAG: hypothetical protein BECKSD772D_GA0070982_10718 [Candidatus Kentron sp. SD]
MKLRKTDGIAQGLGNFIFMDKIPQVYLSRFACIESQEYPESLDITRFGDGNAFRYCVSLLGSVYRKNKISRNQ